MKIRLINKLIRLVLGAWWLSKYGVAHVISYDVVAGVPEVSDLAGKQSEITKVLHPDGWVHLGSQYLRSDYCGIYLVAQVKLLELHTHARSK